MLEKHKIGSGATLSQATMIFFFFQWHTSTESIKKKLKKIKINLRQESDHGCDRKKLKMEKKNCRHSVSCL